MDSISPAVSGYIQHVFEGTLLPLSQARDTTAAESTYSEQITLNGTAKPWVNHHQLDVCGRAGERRRATDTLLVKAWRPGRCKPGNGTWICKCTASIGPGRLVSESTFARIWPKELHRWLRGWPSRRIRWPRDAKEGDDGLWLGGKPFKEKEPCKDLDKGIDIEEGTKSTKSGTWIGWLPC